jgi:DNA-binding LacI/PurR family transcriptional regulator/ribosomal protein S25
MATSKGKSQGRKKRLTSAEVARLQELCRDRLMSDLLEAEPGAPIAGQRSLSEQYGISLSVVRSTLASLKREGIIASVPRGGMRLASKPKLPKSLAGVKLAFIAHMELTNPDSRKSRPAVICAGLERSLNEQGGTLQFFNTWDVAKFQTIVAKIKRQDIEAILHSGSSQTSNQDELKMLGELGLPMVAIDTKSRLCPMVTFDNAQIGCLQAEHILELGHREVCILEFPNYEWSDSRVQSICEEFQQRNLKTPDRIAFRYPPDKAQVEAFVRSRVPAYTACIAVNDDLGCLLLTEAKAQGIRVPEDLSIVGADDNIDRRHFNLTTVQLSDMELGLAAFNILKERILEPETNKEDTVRLLTCPLIVRKTTDQPQKRKEP